MNCIRICMGMLAVFIFFCGCSVPEAADAHIVAAGDNGLVLWSPNGVAGSWKSIIADRDGGAFACVEYGNSQLVGTGYFSPAIYVSSSGKKWQKVTTATSLIGYDLCYGNGRFVCVQSNNVWWSDSPATGVWTAAGSRSYAVNSICYGNSLFVVAGNSGQIMWSADATGSSWTSVSLGGEHLYGIAYGNSRYAAVGANGQAWTAGSDPSGTWTDASPGGSTLNDVSFGNGRFVAVGDSGAIWWSADGTAGSWTDTGVGGNDLYAVRYCGDRFVAVGANGQIWWSVDGASGTWNDASSGTEDLYALAWIP